MLKTLHYIHFRNGEHVKTDALLQLPHLWNATKKGSLSRSNQHLPGDVENHAYLGGVPVSFQNMNQFILFC